ncbi:hypothetical protein [Acinetobacter oleivorans]|uniref:hypothetical protein n=1 Tax=Acinetobacter oleivorans TaxID=1148157 RepID=UPI000DCFDB71|nr:hypothetical protein [Acinetobacter oleivorans]
MKKILFIFLILTSCYTIGADVDNTLLLKNLEAANTQIEVLKAQVEVMKSYQDKFLTTVYWSLGTVLGIVILLIGYNWFTNFKSQEKEVQTLKNFIQNELNQKKVMLTEDMDKKIGETLRKQNDRIWGEIHRLKYETILSEFKYKKDLKLYSTCILNVNELMIVNKEISSNFRTQQILDLLVEILELADKENKQYILSSDILSTIHKTLNMVGDEYSMIKNKVNNLIKKMQSK